VPPVTAASSTASAEAARARLADLAAAARASGNVARAEEIERMALPPPPPPKLTTAGYVPAYYPGVLQPAQAGTVRLGLSEEVGGIDVRLQIVKTLTVTGTVTSAEPLPAEVNVQLIDPAMPIGNVGVWFRTAGKDGRFSFPGVLPGTYVLHANAGMPASSAGGAGEVTASKEIVVSLGAPADHALRFERGVRVSGALALDTLRGTVDPTKLRVSLEPVMTSSIWEMPVYREPVDAQGRFAAKGVIPGRFRVTVTGLPAGWSLASALFAGREVADHHLVVESDKTYSGVLTFTDRTAEIGGTVTTAMGGAASDQTVIIFPEDRTLWVPSSRRIQLVRPDAEGRYTIRSLPAGDYRVAAVLDPESGIQFDRDFLAKQLPLAQQINLAAGERKTQDIRVR